MLACIAALASIRVEALNPAPHFCMDPGAKNKTPPRPDPDVPVVDGGARYALGLVLLVVVFAAVRWAGMTCDLWLDEIWSLGLIREIKSPWEILTKVHHDNNHPLNSLWLHLLPPAGPAWTYRLLAWFAGSATVLLAGLIARRQFRLMHPDAGAGVVNAAGLLTAVLVGGAHLLVHYSSEARGYAPAVAGGFLALYALLHASGRATGWWALVYGLACGLGLLSHLAMVQVMAAGLAWSAVQVVRERNRWRVGLGRLAGWHTGPWICFALYYFGFVRRLSIGGGPENPLGGVLGDMAAFTLGFPVELGLWLALPVLLSVTGVTLGLVWRRDAALAVFYALVVFILPAIGPGLSGFSLLFPRYFIISAAAALLLVGYALTRIWVRGGGWRVASLVLLALFLGGNALHVVRLGRDGRGQYQAALRYLAERTPTEAISLCSDSDFRNGTLIRYYATAAGTGRRIRYYPGDRVPRAGTQWLIIHRLDGGVAPPEAVTDPWGNGYVLEKVFPHAPLSGWDWFVYRRWSAAEHPTSKG